ncbi:putative membrane protein, partial [gut metagenome]
MWENYMEYGPQYDTVNDTPLIPGETEWVQETSFKKLSTETRKTLRAAMVDRVIEYWQSERLIPEGGIVKELRKAAILETYHQTGQYAKESDELKHLLNDCIVQTINKELRKKSSILMMVQEKRELIKESLAYKMVHTIALWMDQRLLDPFIGWVLPGLGDALTAFADCSLPLSEYRQ